MLRPLLASALLWLAAPAARADEIRLVMVEEDGCIYCARWLAEIGPEYPLTPEGRAAPLLMVDIDEIPEAFELASRPRFTPTFLLMDGTTELARLEGYAGEDFFWGLLARMLDDNEIDWMGPWQ